MNIALLLGTQTLTETPQSILVLLQMLYIGMTWSLFKCLPSNVAGTVFLQHRLCGTNINLSFGAGAGLNYTILYKTNLRIPFGMC